MKANIVKIGNSQGIRIPKPILEQCGFKDEVNIEVKDKKIIISVFNKPRHNWNLFFSKMAETGDDKLIIEDNPELSSWDKEEWEW